MLHGAYKLNRKQIRPFQLLLHVHYFAIYGQNRTGTMQPIIAYVRIGSTSWRCWNKRCGSRRWSMISCLKTSTSSRNDSSAVESLLTAAIVQPLFYVYFFFSLILIRPHRMHSVHTVRATATYGVAWSVRLSVSHVHEPFNK